MQELSLPLEVWAQVVPHMRPCSAIPFPIFFPFIAGLDDREKVWYHLLYCIGRDKPVYFSWLLKLPSVGLELLVSNENGLFHHAAQEGRLKYMQLLHQRFGVGLQHDPDPKYHLGSESCFSVAASRGHVHVLDWLWTTFSIQPQEDPYVTCEVARTALNLSGGCATHHALEWLLNKYQLRWKDTLNLVLYFISFSNLRWLMTLGPVTSADWGHAHSWRLEDRAKMSVQDGTTREFHWFLKTFPDVPLHTFFSHALYAAASHGYVDILAEIVDTWTKKLGQCDLTGWWYFRILEFTISERHTAAVEKLLELFGVQLLTEQYMDHLNTVLENVGMSIPLLSTELEDR